MPFDPNDPNNPPDPTQLPPEAFNQEPQVSQPSPFDNLQVQQQQAPPPTAQQGPLKSLLTNFFGGMGRAMMTNAGLDTPEEAQRKQQQEAIKQQLDQSTIQYHQATTEAIKQGNEEIEIPQDPLPDGTPRAPLRLARKYATPAIIQNLKNQANPNLQMTTIGPEHVAISPQLAPLLGQKYPTMLLDKSILGTAAQQNKAAAAPGKPIKVQYDQGIPVSVTDSQGTAYDVNDPDLPKALKPITQAALNAHKQRVREQTQMQASAFGQQLKMNEVKQANLTNSTKTMIEAAPKVISFVDRIDKLVDEQRNQLGPLAGRWNEFMTGKVGAPSPEFTKLRTNVGLMTTLLMRMHVGARGGEYIMKHFQDLIDSGKQSPENLKAALGEIRQYASDVQAEAPSGSPAAANAPSGGEFTVFHDNGKRYQIPNTLIPGFKKLHPNAR